MVSTNVLSLFLVNKSTHPEKATGKLSSTIETTTFQDLVPGEKTDASTCFV
jgi:hypothetical protein